MDYKVLASGSSGNLYQVNNDLIIDAGLSTEKISYLLNFKLHEVKFCLISHEHGDHAISALQILKSGINTYMSESTRAKLHLDSSSGWRRMKALYYHDLDNTYEVIPFPTIHGESDGFGFMITELSTGEKLFHCTDTAAMNYKFNHVDILAMEINYDEEILDNSDLKNHEKKSLIDNHMGANDFKKFWRANDLNPRIIHILHTSNRGLIDHKKLKSDIKALTGCPTEIH